MQISDTQRKKLAELMNSPHFRSEVVADAAVLDMYLGVGLVMYFSNPDSDRRLALNDLIIDRLSLSRKIEVFSKLPLHGKYKSLECIPQMRKINRIRNHIAHTHYTISFDKIFKDPDSLSIILDYPDGYRKLFTRTKLQLSRVLNTKEFVRYIQNA